VTGRLSVTKIRLLQDGAAHPDGVVRGGGRTGFDRHRIKAALAGLVAAGLIVPNVHGDHYITDAGREALPKGPHS
jgi:hypothetical protein